MDSSFQKADRKISLAITQQEQHQNEKIRDNLKVIGNNCNGAKDTRHKNYLASSFGQRLSIYSQQSSFLQQIQKRDADVATSKVSRGGLGLKICRAAATADSSSSATLHLGQAQTGNSTSGFGSSGVSEVDAANTGYVQQGTFAKPDATVINRLRAMAMVGAAHYTAIRGENSATKSSTNTVNRDISNQMFIGRGQLSKTNEERKNFPKSGEVNMNRISESQLEEARKNMVITASFSKSATLRNHSNTPGMPPIQAPKTFGSGNAGQKPLSCGPTGRPLGILMNEPNEQVTRESSSLQLQHEMASKAITIPAENIFDEMGAANCFYISQKRFMTKLLPSKRKFIDDTQHPDIHEIKENDKSLKSEWKNQITDNEENTKIPDFEIMKSSSSVEGKRELGKMQKLNTGFSGKNVEHSSPIRGKPVIGPFMKWVTDVGKGLTKNISAGNLTPGPSFHAEETNGLHGSTDAENGDGQACKDLVLNDSNGQPCKEFVLNDFSPHKLPPIPLSSIRNRSDPCEENTIGSSSMNDNAAAKTCANESTVHRSKEVDLTQDMDCSPRKAIENVPMEEAGVSSSAVRKEQACFQAFDIAACEIKNGASLEASVIPANRKGSNVLVGRHCIKDFEVSSRENIMELLSVVTNVRTWIKETSKCKSNLAQNTNKEEEGIPQACGFCGQTGHSVTDCSETLDCELKDLGKREEFFKVAIAPSTDLPCLRCLGMGHLGAQCHLSVIEAASRARRTAEIRNWHIDDTSRSLLSSYPNLARSSSGNRDASDGITTEISKLKQSIKGKCKIDSTQEHDPPKICVANLPCSSSRELERTSKNSSPAVLKREINVTVPPMPKGMLESFELVRLSRPDLWRWADSSDFSSRVRGFFLRLRFGQWNKKLGGTGYRMARIKGAANKHDPSKENISIAVDLGDIECTVDGQYVSNRPFTWVEIDEWWRHIWRPGCKIKPELETKWTERCAWSKAN